MSYDDWKCASPYDYGRECVDCGAGMELDNTPDGSEHWICRECEAAQEDQESKGPSARDAVRP